MTSRPLWYSLPAELRSALERYLRRGQTLHRPKREWVADQVIYELWRSNVDAGSTGWQACLIVAKRYQMTGRGVAKVVKRFGTPSGDVY